jgi:GNAT superfamily N-acetyltransferase
VAPTRIATSLDASAISADIAEGFAAYRAWAPSSWQPPVLGFAEIAQFADALTRPDVWCLLALEGDEVIGHVALSRSTREDPGPPPAGTVYVWQLFVRPRWQGRGIAKQLMQAAVTEAGERGYGDMRLWTPQGAGRARRFYEREGWTVTGRTNPNSPFGLPTIEYGRRSVARTSRTLSNAR